MSTLKRIRGIRPVGNDVPREVKPILSEMREAIHQITGDSDLAAIRRANFLDLLRANIGKVPINVGPPTTQDDISVITDPYFQDLKKQTDQALRDLATLFAYSNESEFIIRENLAYIEEVEETVLQHADDLSLQALELAGHAQDLIDLATDIELIEEAISDPVTGLSATSSLLGATVTRVDGTEGSISVLTGKVTSLESEIVDVSALDPGIMWQFESSDDGWTSNATLTPEEYYVTIGADQDAVFTSPSGIAMNGALFQRVVARIRRVSGSGWLGRVTYSTTGMGGHGFDSTNYHLTLSEPGLAGGGWAIVTWDMELLTAGGDDWVTSVVDQIRLELSDDDSTVYEVDWVAVARIAPSYVTATVNALESRVTQAEDDIDLLSAATVSLSGRADDLEDDVSASSLLIDSLSSRVSIAEGEIDSVQSSITLLEGDIEDAQDGISAHGSAISGLDSRLGIAEGSISTAQSNITSLSGRLDLAEPEISGNSDAILALTGRVSASEDDIESHAGLLVSLDGRLDLAEPDISANAGAILALDSRVEATEDAVDSHALSLLSLGSRIDDAESELSGQADAIQTLDSRVGITESGVSASAAAVTMLQAYGRDANRINPLRTPGNATDWSFANADVVSIYIGGRNTVAARIRTNGSVQRTSKFVEIEPSGIYEVRMSVLKNMAHGTLYCGLHSSSDGVTTATAVVPVRNRSIIGGQTSNPYWTSLGVTGANHSQFTANKWYDFTFYVLGPEADPAMCPHALEDGAELGLGHFPRTADGYRLQAGQRFALLRVLNYYNAVQTDAYFNDITIKRLDNQRSAALIQESSARASADGLLNAQWTLKLNANGYVAGFGLAVVGGANGPISSSFNILADRFAVSMPGVSGPVTPFIIANVNGVPTVGVNGNLVVDGTIVTRHLIAEAITTPKIKPNAVSNTVFVQSQTMFEFQSIVDTSIQIISLPVTVEQSGPIRIDWYCELYHNTNTNPTGCAINLYRENTIVQQNVVHWSEATNWLGRIFRASALTYFDVVAAGTYTYRIQILTPNFSGLWATGLRGIAVTEMKR